MLLDSRRWYNRVRYPWLGDEEMMPAQDRKSWYWFTSWTFVVIVNLPIGLLFGSMVTAPSGSAGMAVGVATCWIAGLLVCWHSGRLAEVLCRGGVIIAICQAFPILHIAFGLFGVWLWNNLTGSRGLARDDFSGAIAGFAVTLITAQPLLLAAWLFGGGLRVCFGSDAVKAEDAADYGDLAKATMANNGGVAPRA